MHGVILNRSCVLNDRDHCHTLTAFLLADVTFHLNVDQMRLVDIVRVPASGMDQRASDTVNLADSHLVVLVFLRRRLVWWIVVFRCLVSLVYHPTADFNKKQNQLIFSMNIN